MAEQTNRDQIGSTTALEGFRVLEVGHYLAAPFCAMQLADLGADVIKIEAPGGGDPMRESLPQIEGIGSTFLQLNRNKRSAVVDLKSEAGARIFKQLAATADIVVENLRPGTMSGFGLDYKALKSVNPGLVYVAVSGWGQDGRFSKLPGLDIMAQARSGLMSITGEPEGGPVKVGVPICDLVCGIYGALSAVAALQHRERTGAGQFIDISLFETGVALAVWEAGRYFATGEIAGRQGSAHQALAPYQAFRCLDGWITIGATTDRTWSDLCRVMDLGAIKDDERYRDGSSRFRNRQQLIVEIESATIKRPVVEWFQLLSEAGVPCSPIQDYGQVFNDPGLEERHFFWDAPHPVSGSVRQLGSPMRLSGSPVRRTSAAPLLGQHTTEVLLEIGYSPADVERLEGEGAIR